MEKGLCKASPDVQNTKHIQDDMFNVSSQDALDLFKICCVYVCVCEHVNVNFEVEMACLFSPSKVMWEADPSPTGDVLFFFIVF